MTDARRSWFRSRRRPAAARHRPAGDPVHIAVVLDRSGSMASIASDVIGGCNTFLDGQRHVAGDAVVTLVQFDSQDPFEILVDGADLATTSGVDPARYRPRGNTPLYDAVGAMIGRLDERAADPVHGPEDVVVVLITDGLENASRRWDRRRVFDLIAARKRDGWTFVFLGADQDAYAAGAGIAVARGSAREWVRSPEGVGNMFADLDEAMTGHRSKPSAQRRADVDEFFDPPE